MVSNRLNLHPPYDMVGDTHGQFHDFLALMQMAGAVQASPWGLKGTRFQVLILNKDSGAFNLKPFFEGGACASCKTAGKPSPTNW